MATRIELSEIEIKVLNQHLNGEFGQFTATDEQMEVMMRVIKKARQLCEELDAYEEMGDDLIQWFWDKYKAQCQ